MKKQKTIVIKNTRLQKARNNLRIILIKAVSEQSSLILKKCRNKKGNEIGEILRESQNLWHILRRSICICPVCNKKDQDMTYFPPHGTWYCVCCFDRFHIEWEIDIENLKAHPDIFG